MPSTYTNNTCEDRWKFKRMRLNVLEVFQHSFTNVLIAFELSSKGERVFPNTKQSKFETNGPT